MDYLLNYSTPENFGTTAFGVDSVHDTAALKAALETGLPVKLGQSSVYLIDSITVERTTGALLMYADSGIREYAPRIAFNDNGSVTGFGLKAPALKLSKFDNLFITTLNGVDGRTASGSFTGIDLAGPGRNCITRVTNCTFDGFSNAGIYAESIIDSSFIDVRFQRCKSGAKFRRSETHGDIASGTTVSFIRGYNTSCDIAHDVGRLNQSTWSGVIWEYCRIGAHVERGDYNTVRNCYAEANTGYAFLAVSGTVVFENNYSNRSTGTNEYVHEQIVANLGFDFIGDTVIERNRISAREVRFYDRSGVKSEVLKASTNKSKLKGQLGIQSESGDFLGLVPKLLAEQPAGFASQTVQFLIKDGAVQGLPADWTATRVAEGVWDVTFPSAGGNRTFPNIQCTGTWNRGNSEDAPHYVHAFVRIRDSGNRWATQHEATLGFRVSIFETNLCGVLKPANAAAFVSVTW